MDRAELINQIHDGRAELEAALALFDERNMGEPLLPNGWSVKDVIAHIGFWEGRIASLYDILSAGDVPEESVTAETLDELNARMFEENQLLPLGIVRLNEQEAYHALLNVAETAPEDDLYNAERFAWTKGTPFYQFIVENTYAHYADHLPDLRTAARRDE